MSTVNYIGNVQMKILIINNHYFVHGGPDRYFFNVKAALERRGHMIIPFSFDYDDTVATPFRKYFPMPITGKGPYMLKDIKLSLRAKLKAVSRMFHNGEVDSRFRHILREERPDLVFSLYLSSSFLPNILQIAKQEFGLPIVYRLSDFHMFCSSYLFCRKGKVCTECLGNAWSAVRYRCVHNSCVASALRVLQMKYVKQQKWYDSVDAYICPSKLMAGYLTQNGISNKKIVHIPTFSNDLGQSIRNLSRRPYVLYFGRVVPEKGVETLVRAFNCIISPSFSLRLVGPVDHTYRAELMSLLDDEHKPLVEMPGPEHGAILDQTIRHALLVVHPAVWLENMPNSILEAMSAKKPILASNLGSLPELIEDGVNGHLFEAGDVDDLSDKLKIMAGDSKKLLGMGEAGRRLYEEKYTEEAHVHILGKVFHEVLPVYRSTSDVMTSPV